MTFEQLNEVSIQQSFEEYHKANPAVYECFKAQALRAIEKGRTNFSSKAIINWIRWEKYLEIHGKITLFKINDAYTSRYARLFIEEFPQYQNIFELRNLRA